jgi:hypothetical protein
MPNMCWHIPCGTTTYVGGSSTYVGAVHSMWNDLAMHVHSSWYGPAVSCDTFKRPSGHDPCDAVQPFVALTFSMCLNMQSVECDLNPHVIAVCAPFSQLTATVCSAEPCFILQFCNCQCVMSCVEFVTG